MPNKNNICIVSRAVIIDQNHILLCKTLDMPTNFYFLPGGHVENCESAQKALIREMLEESGAQVAIKRFLGCLEYSFVPGYSSICHNHEYSFIFEIQSELLTRNHKPPALEAHIELIWMPLQQLGDIDFRPAPLKKLLPNWLSSSFNNAFQSEVLA